MNIRIRFILFLPFLLWLSGCCPNGCFVLTGEAYRELAYPKPMRDRWIKEGASENDRVRDWEACGGAKNGDCSHMKKPLILNKEQMKKILSTLITDFSTMFSAACALLIACYTLEHDKKIRQMHRKQSGKAAEIGRAHV